MHPLDLIVGPMYSAKSSELIKLSVQAKVGNREVLAVRPDMGDGQTKPFISSRFGDMTIRAVLVSNCWEILAKMSPQINLVLIDEGQFFGPGIVEVVYTIRQSARVVIAGLNLDFRGLPFGPIPDLLAMASSIKILSATCSICGEEAEFSQRLTDGQPSSAFAEDVSIEGRQVGDVYEPRCHKHFQPPLDLKEWFQAQNRP
ncbi:MAG: thymidine kinase [Patescibacteria group bacterium]